MRDLDTLRRAVIVKVEVAPDADDSDIISEGLGAVAGVEVHLKVLRQNKINTIKITMLHL